MQKALVHWITPVLLAGALAAGAPCAAQDPPDNLAKLFNFSDKPWIFKPAPIPHGSSFDINSCSVKIITFDPKSWAEVTREDAVDSSNAFTVLPQNIVVLDFSSAGSRAAYRRWYMTDSSGKNKYIVAYARNADDKVGKLGPGGVTSAEMTVPDNVDKVVKFKKNSLQILADGW